MLETPASEQDRFFQEADPASFKHVLEKAEEKGLDLSFESIKEIKAQIEEVKRSYFGTEKWMKSPNGLDTKLTEGQWITVRTKNFKKWFGDWESDPSNASKVIDKETKEPMLMYHASKKDFTEFKSQADIPPETERFLPPRHGIYFASNAEGANNFIRETEGGIIYQVFLNIRKPKYFSTKSLLRKFNSYIRDRGYYRLMDLLPDPTLKYRSVSETTKKKLGLQGFDGCIDVEDKQHEKGSWNGFYIIFSGVQAKSAIGNIGTFSSDSEDMAL